jgi:hypothetical protein
MSDRHLFQHVACHFVLGALLGALFTVALLALNDHHLLEVVLASGSPATILVILFFGISANFAFGMAITGFHFVIMHGTDDL